MGKLKKKKETGKMFLTKELPEDMLISPNQARDNKGIAIIITKERSRPNSNRQSNIQAKHNQWGVHHNRSVNTRDPKEEEPKNPRNLEEALQLNSDQTILQKHLLKC